MAARASSTDAGRARPGMRDARARRWMPAVLGMTWGHASVVAAGSIVARSSAWAESPAGLNWAKILEWTLMLPLTLSLALVHGTSSPLQALASEGMALQTLALPALAGWALALLGSALWRHRRTAATRVLLAAFLVAGGLAGVSAVRATAEERAAERVFMRMVAADSAPWNEPASRSAARTLVARYPESRWASEGWRVVATDAEQRENLPEALRAWRSFEACFADATASGRAFGALNRARILEMSAPPDVAAAQYLRALRTMQRGDGTAQPWIEPESARGLARASRRNGLYATAGYWAARARTDEEN